LILNDTPFMRSLNQEFTVQFSYSVHFTNGLFKADNPLLTEVVGSDGSKGPRKILFVVDQIVLEKTPGLLEQITAYVEQNPAVFTLAAPPIVVPGGEACKNEMRLVDQLQESIHRYHIDRHSYVAAVGGGAVLDLVGFAAAIAHRGIRHIRIPTTVLAQNDSGVGVKNGVNNFNKKNFTGTFSPPFAVLNDFEFLRTLNDRDWRAGISEAIKVSLIKDAAFFRFIQDNAQKLRNREMAAMEELIYRCAEMHLQHIGGAGDPFEKGSSRPLDFGHWAAHTLEQLTDYSIRHGEAVAIGIALDSTYSYLAGMLTKAEWQEILELIRAVGFDLYVPELAQPGTEPDQPLAILKGLADFREHLGGELTIMLLERIGRGVEVHEMDVELITRAVRMLEAAQYTSAPQIRN
jgi:3-dehydroquinate synthase